jgi:biotin operon repressor
MLETSARLLSLLSLLQARRDWSGPELAERLEVGIRTIRRDVERLRTLGYPVHARSGVAGGYRLGAGAQLPPLLLDAPLALVAERVAPTVATLEAIDEQTCLMRTGGNWYGEIAIYIAAIGVDFEILDPPNSPSTSANSPSSSTGRHDDASHGRQTRTARPRPAPAPQRTTTGITAAVKGRSDPPSPATAPRSALPGRAQTSHKRNAQRDHWSQQLTLLREHGRPERVSTRGRPVRPVR